MRRDNCPICKSKKLKFISLNEAKEGLKALLDSGLLKGYSDDSINKLKIMFDQSFENDKTLEELYGREASCENCGFNFLENEDYSQYDLNPPTPVSFEEFKDYIESNLSDSFFAKQIIRHYERNNVFYLEVADSIIERYNTLLEKESYDSFESDDLNLVN